ncbi:hypothetical protein [Pedobacter miscanthi]|uniref:hypothetical protein n=1 Tax=Pedobacter miscanthi TaxID=2259170 RepID=UPI00292ED7F4|nr:hypothetical protein [Pedobacter miscanthi]
MKNRYKNIIFLSLAMGIGLAVSFASIAKRSAKKTVEKEAAPIDTAFVVDTTNLERLAKIAKDLHFDQENISISGKLSVHNGSDSSENVSKLPYRLIKRGTAFYSSLGLTETLNANGLYVFVDKVQKKILVSQGKKITAQNILPDMQQMIKRMKEEEYQIRENVVSPTENKISLLNPNHIQCKEYSIYFDKANLHAKGVSIRMSNIDDPLNDKKDKTVDFRYANTLADASKLMSTRILKKLAKNQYSATEAYKGYEIIVRM